MSTPTTLSNRQALEKKYNGSRMNLLLVVVFTVVNIILLVTNSNTYFVFSASIPYFLVGIAMEFCGMYPEEYYTEYYGEDLANFQFTDTSFFVICLVIAIVIIALYLISWIFSKNNKTGWLIFALIFFAIDTLGMFVLLGINFDSIIDIAFHVWVIVSLFIGISAGSKLKNLSEDEVFVEETEKVQDSDFSGSLQNSAIIRIADTSVKSRTLLEADAVGHTVTYRRVKRVNELVIDGNVYDEMEALIEMPHTLTANIDGHTIQVGYDGANSYLDVDGERVAKKFRLY